MEKTIKEINDLILSKIDIDGLEGDILDFLYKGIKLHRGEVLLFINNDQFTDTDDGQIFFLIEMLFIKLVEDVREICNNFGMEIRLKFVPFEFKRITYSSPPLRKGTSQ